MTNRRCESGISRPGRIELMVSAFVCPGGGQFMQRRWVIGAVYMLAFVALGVWLVVLTLVPAFQNVRIALAWAQGTWDEELILPSVPRIAAAVGLLLLVYVANLVDISLANVRRRRREAMSRPGPPPVPGQESV